MILCLPTIPSPPDPPKQHVLLFHHPVHHHTTSGLPPQPRCHPNDFESFQFHTAPPTFPTKTSLPPHFLFNLPCLRNYQFQDLLLLQLVKSSHVSKVWIWNNYCLMDNLTWLFILSFLTNWSLDLQFLFKRVRMNRLHWYSVCCKFCFYISNKRPRVQDSLASTWSSTPQLWWPFSVPSTTWSIHSRL